MRITPSRSMFSSIRALARISMIMTLAGWIAWKVFVTVDPLDYLALISLAILVPIVARTAKSSLSSSRTMSTKHQAATMLSLFGSTIMLLIFAACGLGLFDGYLIGRFDAQGRPIRYPLVGVVSEPDGLLVWWYTDTGLPRTAPPK